MYRTTLQWVEQHCTLGDLRPSECHRLSGFYELKQTSIDANGRAISLGFL